MSDYSLFTSESVSEGHPDKMCDQISVGSRSKGKRSSDKERKRRRELVEAENWSTAELFSFVLRGWVLEMKKLGFDVEIAVLQLWSLYLR